MQKLQGHPASRIHEWPGGYAASFAGNTWLGYSRCCEGHRTPEEAKAHGLEIVASLYDDDIKLWKEQAV